MSVSVKICGIRHGYALDVAREAGADWAGLVFFARSPRHVTAAQAALLAKRAEGLPLVGLFVDPADEEIERVLESVELKALQVYGRSIDAAALDARFRLPVWRAVGVAALDDLPREAGGAEQLVIEAKPPRDATRPGGNATAFDWRILSGWQAPAPWLLAGGLTPENVAEAIRVSGARAVDVSSGVESAPGVKDPALIRAFIRSARSAAA